jgi:hypothetical protein
MAAHWCKVASNLDSHPKIRRAGRLGREVFLFALRRNAEPGNPVPGRLPADELEPWYVADQLQMTETEAITGVTAAIAAGLLAKDGNSYLIVSWKDGWGKGGGSDAARQARYRENKKLREDDGEVVMPTVTRNVTRNVTPVTRNVTQRNGDGCYVDQIRGEETNHHTQVASDLPREAPVKRRKGIPDDWQPRAEERELAARLGLDCDTEADEFKTYWLGDGRPKKDWHQTFRNRLQAQSKRPPRSGQSGLWPSQSTPTRKIEKL